METKKTDELAFFDFPIEQFADRSTRWLLEDRENVRGLLEIVAEHLVAHLDFSRLTHINRSFIPDNLREQESDIVYSAPFHSESKTDELLIYILIEHQSTVDVTMGFRVLFYVKAPKPKGLGLCFVAVRLPRKVLHLLHRGTQGSPQDIYRSVDISIVV